MLTPSTSKQAYTQYYPCRIQQWLQCFIETIGTMGEVSFTLSHVPTHGFFF